MKKILITGGAGFIGSHLVDRLVDEGYDLTVVDNFDPFYARSEKDANLGSHLREQRIRLVEADISSPDISSQLPNESFDCLVHLAALAGVRPSIERPGDYQRVNVVGTASLLEFAHTQGIPQFVFASSSSVYGSNSRFPWSEADAELQPISPYAVSKLSGEMLGHVFANLFGIRFIGLRFFTVYGPRQRPDLAIRKFAEAIAEGRPITLFGDGSSSRDYTYVDDVVSGILAAMTYRQTPFEIVNLGNSHTVSLMDLVKQLETAVDRTAVIQWLPAQQGDVEATCADLTKARQLLRYQPTTSLPAGLQKTVAWLRTRDGTPRLIA